MSWPGRHRSGSRVLIGGIGESGGRHVDDHRGNQFEYHRERQRSFELEHWGDRDEFEFGQLGPDRRYDDNLDFERHLGHHWRGQLWNRRQRWL